MNFKRIAGRSMAIVGLLALAACTTYTQVTDPSSQKTFYTDDLKINKGSGGAEFTDAMTGARVQLMSYEAKEITPEAFDKGIGKDAKK